MSHWRHDPLTDRRVRIAPDRELRPTDLLSNDQEAPTRCPFCRGAEEDTPPELDRIEDASGAWLARTVPNRYPALELPDGTHEVILESPRHALRFADLPHDEAAAAVQLWMRRIAHGRGIANFDYALLFKNEGRAAGASLAHVHSQLTLLAETPSGVHAMWKRVARTPAALLAPPATRLVAPSEGLRIMCPEAPRGPFETWIVSNEPFVDTDPQQLASTLQQAIRLATDASHTDGFNLVVQLPPRSLAQPVGDLWWIEVLPRSSAMAGFELATDCMINPVTPESAAEQLRKAWK